MRYCHVLAVCAVASASIAAAKPASDVSWGKPGVSLDQYASDAGACAAATRHAAVSIKPGTLRQLDALSSAQLLDIAVASAPSDEANPMAIVEHITSTKSETDIARRTNTFGAHYVAIAAVDLKDELQAVLDECLTAKGYVQIRLTTDQAKALSKLKRHSAERTAYLHSIDSDPAFIARQRLDAPGS